MNSVQKAGDKVVVAGGTGGVGQLCAERLMDKGFKVRVLTRSKDKAIDIFGQSSGIEVLEVDLRDAESIKKKEVFKGCAGAVLALGTTAFPTERCFPVPTSATDCIQSSDMLQAGVHVRCCRWPQAPTTAVNMHESRFSRFSCLKGFRQGCGADGREATGPGRQTTSR